MAEHFEANGENKDVAFSRKQAVIYVNQQRKADMMFADWGATEQKNIHWSKYQIKETDMRIKTANFTSPDKIDLTNGQYVVLISTPNHENFSGIILDMEYDKKTGLYTYQCQDWSRKYLSKITFVTTTQNLLHVLRFLISTGGVTLNNPTSKQLETYATRLSGIRGYEKYNTADWKWGLKTNPMGTRMQILVKDKRIIDVIRDLVFGTTRFIDVYFNQKGILQIEPYNKNDFLENTLEIDYKEISDVKFKFDTTNIVTGTYVITSKERGDSGTLYSNEILKAFFGNTFSTVDNSSQTTSSSNPTKSTSSSSTTSNPYGNKAKKIWINSDNGSCSFKNSIASILQNKGWTVHNGGCCSNCHYSDYYNVSSDYQVYATLYNGFCAGTIREAYSDRIQNVLKNKGVVLVVMWDTSDWTDPQGMKPYKYGDFSGYNAGRAWDDNFSSSDPSINNVASWLKSKNAKYCASPTAEGVVEQFLAGGYFAYKG